MTLKKQILSFILFVLTACIATKGNAFFGAKFEPPDGTIYHGAQAEVRPESVLKSDVDWDGIEEYVKACGKHPKLIMHYISFDERAFDILKSAVYEISQKEYEYIPQIGLDFYGHSNHEEITNRKDITYEIAQGNHDDKIRELANLFKKMGIPIFLRPGYEFGGNGYGNRASKSYWTKAWRRIYDIFQTRRAYNVAFVWNTLDAKDFMDYYPGDAYVDWWAINVFENNTDQDQFIDGFIRQAAKHRKPVMIAESTPRRIGSVGGKNAWNKWYRPYFNLIRQYPNIKAFCYINASWETYPDRSFAFDCRIQSDKIVEVQYQKVLSNKRFINANRK